MAAPADDQAFVLDDWMAVTEWNRRSNVRAMTHVSGCLWPGARVRTNRRKAPADACPHLLAALARARDGGQASCKSDQLKLPTFLMVSAAQEPMLGPPRLFMRSSWVWWTFACPGSALWLLVFPSPLFLMPLQEGALHGSR